MVRFPAAVFGGLNDERAVHLAELARDRDEVALEVDVAPAQSGELAPPEAGVGGGEHERFPAGPDCGGELGDLLGRRDLHLGVSLGARALERAG